MDYQDWQTQKSTIFFWHQARKNLLSLLLARHIRPIKKLAILEIGCGTGEHLPLLAKYGQVTGLDNNPSALVIAQNYHQQLIYKDINTYQLPPASFDLICCFDVLEHLPNDQKTLKNIYQALKPSGVLLFTAPAHSWLFSQHDKALAHYRRYNKKDLKNKLQQTGFKKLSLNYWNCFLLIPIIAWRFITKFLPKIKSDVRPLPKPINHFFNSFLQKENKLITKGKKLPNGLTIYGWARKL